MAAGQVFRQVLRNTGQVITLGFWVPDTASPDANGYPQNNIIDTTNGEPLGKVGDAAVTTDISASMLAFLRGLVKQTGEVQASPTANTILDRLKQISFSLAGTLTVAAHNVTNAGTFAVQAAITAASGAIASGAVAVGAIVDGAMVTIGAKADAKSTATDTTAVSLMAVSKQISASVQALQALIANAAALTSAGGLKVLLATDQLSPGDPVKKEDDPSANQDYGYATMYVRSDTPGANSSGADGDYEMFKGSEGAGHMALLPLTRGGWLTYKSLDVDETEEEVKATRGQIGGIVVSNTTASKRYLKLYNDTAANVVVGTTVPKNTFLIPGNADGVTGNIPIPIGVEYDTAITIACTTGAADNDTGAPGTGDVIVNLFYK